MSHLSLRRNQFGLVLLLCLAFLSQIRVSHAQKIVKVKGKTRTFEYQGEVFKYKDMDHVFAQDAESNRLFLKARKQLKTARDLGYTSLICATIGGIGLLGTTSCNGLGCVPSGLVFAGFMLVVAVPLTGIIGLSLDISGSRKLRKAIRVYNHSESPQPPEKMLSKIGLKDGRLGLWITF